METRQISNTEACNITPESGATPGGRLVKALWQDQVIAESNQTVVVEGNHYFPPDAVRTAFLLQSPTQTVCGWKGTASYYSIVAGGQENKDAAWYYPDPKTAANSIKGRIAFWKGVKVVEE